MHKRRTIADALTLLMRRVGLSDNELSRRTDVAQPTISRIRKGQRVYPRAPTIQPLADYFRVSLGQLRGEEPLPWEAGGEPERDEASDDAPSEALDQDVIKEILDMIERERQIHGDPEQPTELLAKAVVRFYYDIKKAKKKSEQQFRRSIRDMLMQARANNEGARDESTQEKTHGEKRD